MKKILLALILILLVGSPVMASSLSTHLSVSLMVSPQFDDPHSAFFTNMMLHAALDYMDPEYYMANLAGNYDYVGFEIILSGIQIRRIIKEPDAQRRKILWYGAAGSVFFDALEIPNKMAGNDPLFDWHYNHGDGIHSKGESMLVSGAVFALSWRF